MSISKVAWLVREAVVLGTKQRFQTHIADITHHIFWGFTH